MAQQAGTLVPGQSISVNKYTVQVDRYLSQGATPVYNTTHHVLKRIAVANDAMLTEVKKEVDIMRLLKGHPNIVHLIDAAWHRMPNGMYEVFILMEFCPGGGIIDMMNRRLRERLTEAEILQIFVDVCEGVAYMHNSRPPLLHRDLKVENILQSTPTSFKLCDFGSATTVAPRPPATTQEIRALEADLNRHTTLQYRAPEMVDPYLRRAVDEKSDVWALGVLLYKLCYYTTPFEEHGPLAILNVQYRIPPYPVYSTQMNSLIASMLREHGAQRPSVFELLALVHRLRGTTSPFTYTIPPPQPLSPRHTQFPTANPLESTVTYRPQQNAGMQARDKVLEAIAPMRRGRPEPQHSPSQSRSRNPSPQKERERAQPPLPPPQQPPAKNWLDEEEKAWRAVSVKSSTSAPNKPGAMDDADAWMARGRGGNAGGDAKASSKGFGDDFAEKLWDSFDPNGVGVSAKPSPTLPSPGKPAPLRQPAFTGSLASPAPRGGRERDNKDAFEGLGALGAGGRAAPTLGEARMLRTGLASSSSAAYKFDAGDYNSYKPSRPSPSPHPSYGASLSTPGQASGQSLGTLSPHPPGQALKPVGSGSSWHSQAPSSMALSRPGSSALGGGNDAAETRFPSLEELDKTFSGVGSGSAPANGDVPPPLPARKESAPQSQSQGQAEVLRPTPYGLDGVRSQQITGVAMREGVSSRGGGARAGNASASASASASAAANRAEYSSSSRIEHPRPVLTRKHRSSLTMKHSYASSSSEDAGPSPSMRIGVGSVSSSGLPSPSSRDWLTGDDDEQVHATPAPVSSHGRTATTPAVPSTRTPIAEYKPSTPVLRESPSKRASVIERSALHIHHGVPVQRDHVPPTPDTPTARAARVFPAIDLSSEPSEHGWGAAEAGRQKEVDSASSADEGPEDVNGFMSTPMSKTRPTQEVGRPKRKGRQSSVHDLVDLYGGAGGLAFPPKEKEKDRVSPSLLEELTPRKTAVNQPQIPTETKAKRRSTALASVSTANPVPSNSVNSTLSPPNSGRPPPSGSPRSNKSSATTTPVSPRSRPQSMFIFPSKPTETSASNTLSPPEDPKPRSHLRRTSISDMVQRYEAIGGAAKSPTSATASSPIPPPLATKPAVLAAPRAENGRFSSVSSQGTSSSSSVGANGRPPGSTSLPLPPASSSAGLGDPTKSASGGLPPRVSPTGMPRTATPQREPESGLPRTRRTSFMGSGASSGPPSRKGTADERSPSPERPYQGVGKLIDQWQRKTAEPDRGPVGSKRGGSAGLVAKRAGLVGKGV
ncbi:hypothetical protein B0H11DRAFT_1899362 [Mycena galericulata]|nr:hypothetical protein B0H11DRAFT_1899362 [Mycena galericulata]